MIKKEELMGILYIMLEDLLQDCYNDLYEYEDIEKEKADLIYKNIRLFALKLRDRLGEEL